MQHFIEIDDVMGALLQNTNDKISPFLPNSKPVQPGILAGLKLLVVDDCEENQFLFTHLLSRKGANVQIAGNGEEALTLVRNGSYDLILMDIQMPVMDGFSALANLKEMGSFTPVIAITAESLPAQIKKILDAGFSSVVTKPLDKDYLLQVIQETIRA